MKPLHASIALLVLTPSAAFAAHPTAEVGVGVPELIHMRIGAFVAPRASVELYVSNVVFNWLTGVTVSGYLLGNDRPDGPPRHALLARGTVAFNPLAEPIRVRGGGETIAAGLLLDVGYALTTNAGFMFDAALGALLYLEDTVAVGPSATLSVGWRF